MVTELDQSYLSSTVCVASDRKGGREGGREGGGREEGREGGRGREDREERVGGGGKR